MQELGSEWQNCCQNHDHTQNMVFLAKNTPIHPHTPKLEFFMKDSGTLGKSLPRIPPPKLELLMEDLEVKAYQEYPVSNWNSSLRI